MRGMVDCCIILLSFINKLDSESMNFLSRSKSKSLLRRNLLKARSVTTASRTLPFARRPSMIGTTAAKPFFLAPLQLLPTTMHHNRALTTSSSAPLSPTDIQKRLDAFQDLFVEARLCIEDATDSAGTTYYEEDATSATEAVNEAVQVFEELINDIDNEDEKNRVLRSQGLKVEQLKGELEMALRGGDHH